MALKSVNQPIRWKERIGLMAIGHTFKQVEIFIFDLLLYPAAIALFGTVIGGLIMTVLSAVVCYLYILFYDWAKKDWLGLELLKEIRDGKEKQGRIVRFVQRIIRKGNGIAFLILSCYEDAFATTVYLRQGAEAYNGLSSRDWKIFWASVLVGNLWWTVIMTLVVEGVRLIISWLGFN